MRKKEKLIKITRLEAWFQLKSSQRIEINWYGRERNHVDEKIWFFVYGISVNLIFLFELKFFLIVKCNFKKLKVNWKNKQIIKGLV
jgi:hypothetical protein